MATKSINNIVAMFILIVSPVIAYADSGRVFELRTYTTHEGKLQALHERFVNHTLNLFEEHGMTNVGYWIPVDPELSEDTLIYIVSHENRDAVAKNWESFGQNPKWQKVYKDSHEDGPIVKHIDSVLLNAAEYSAIK